MARFKCILSWQTANGLRSRSGSWPGKQWMSTRVKKQLIVRWKSYIELCEKRQRWLLKCKFLILKINCFPTFHIISEFIIGAIYIVDECAIINDIEGVCRIMCIMIMFSFRCVTAKCTSKSTRWFIKRGTVKRSRLRSNWLLPDDVNPSNLCGHGNCESICFRSNINNKHIIFVEHVACLFIGAANRWTWNSRFIAIQMDEYRRRWSEQLGNQSKHMTFATKNHSKRS